MSADRLREQIGRLMVRVQELQDLLMEGWRLDPDQDTEDLKEWRREVWRQMEEEDVWIYSGLRDLRPTSDWGCGSREVRGEWLERYCVERGAHGDCAAWSKWVDKRDRV